MTENNANYVRIVNRTKEQRFMGTPEEAAKWVEDCVPPETFEAYQILIGSSRHPATVSEFLEGVKKRQESIVRVRRQKVMELVAKAMIKQDTATYHGDTSGMANVGIEITDEIMKLFEGVEPTSVPAIDTSACVPRHYEMDPETEDLLSSGRKLWNGAVVLAEDPNSRASDLPNHREAYPHEISNVREKNRWASISEIEFQMDKQTGKKIVLFVATYSDGTKRKRWTSANHAWLVKKDSIPKED